jgi:HPt (histidine-containing phosphotransfer) domain-containing protein
MTFSHDRESESVRAEFDSDELLDRIDGDRSLFMDIVRIFLQETPTLISALGAGVDTGNADVVEKTAHAIKGSCAMISAKRLERLAHELEIMGRNGNVNGADAVYHRLVECFDALKRIMVSFLEKMGRSSC